MTIFAMSVQEESEYSMGENVYRVGLMPLGPQMTGASFPSGSRGAEKLNFGGAGASPYAVEKQQYKSEVVSKEQAKNGINAAAKDSISQQDAKKQAILSTASAGSISDITAEISGLSNDISGFNNELSAVSGELNSVSAAILLKQAELTGVGVVNVGAKVWEGVKGFFTGKQDTSASDAMEAKKKKIKSDIAGLVSKQKSAQNRKTSIAQKISNAQTKKILLRKRKMIMLQRMLKFQKFKQSKRAILKK